MWFIYTNIIIYIYVQYIFVLKLQLLELKLEATTASKNFTQPSSNRNLSRLVAYDLQRVHHLPLGPRMQRWHRKLPRCFALNKMAFCLSRIGVIVYIFTYTFMPVCRYTYISVNMFTYTLHIFLYTYEITSTSSESWVPSHLLEPRCRPRQMLGVVFQRTGIVWKRYL